MILRGKFSFPEHIMYSWDNCTGLNHGMDGHILLEILKNIYINKKKTEKNICRIGVD